MSRLVAARATRDVVHGVEGPSDNYLDRVAKYVPAEIIAAYVAAQGAVVAATQEATSERLAYLGISALVLLIVTPLYFWQLGRAAGEPWLAQAGVSAVAFIVWAYALGHLPTELGIYSPLTGTLVLIFFSLLSGLVQPHEKGA